MTARNAVADDVRMTNERLGSLTRRQDELKRRINEGAISYDWAMGEIQRVIEGRVGSSFLRSTGELTIQIPALPRPTLEEFRKECSIIRGGNGIERDESTTEAVTMVLSTVLNLGEYSISHREFELRLFPIHGKLLGYQHAQWLVKHQESFPALMALPGKINIDFPGLVVVSYDGSRLIRRLHRVGRLWASRWGWDLGSFYSDDRVASVSEPC